MILVQPYFLVVPTAEAKTALGERIGEAGVAAWREIVLAAKGVEIAHLQFVFGRLTLAVCSRVRRDGRVEIEIAVGDPRRPSSAITAEQLRRAEAAARAKNRPRPQDSRLRAKFAQD